MKIEFNIREWRARYNQINILGQYLKDSRPDADGNPAKFKISLTQRHKTENEIAELMRLNDQYLDRCHLRPKDPKWYYDRFNEETWASSEQFVFWFHPQLLGCRERFSAGKNV